MKENKKLEPKIEETVEEVKDPKTTEVKCVRRHLNDEYRRAIEVDEVITLSTKYAKYLKEIGIVE